MKGNLRSVMTISVMTVSVMTQTITREGERRGIPSESGREEDAQRGYHRQGGKGLNVILTVCDARSLQREEDEQRGYHRPRVTQTADE
jgi:hypothetical protein